MKRIAFVAAALMLSSVGAATAAPKSLPDVRTIWLRGAPGDPGTIRVELDSGTWFGTRLVREIDACQDQGDGFSTCAPTMYHRLRHDRHGNVRYSGSRRARHPSRRVIVRARFEGETLVAFTLKFFGDNGSALPPARSTFGVADVTRVDVVPPQ
jgi:hypothetical protein